MHGCNFLVNFTEIHSKPPFSLEESPNVSITGFSSKATHSICPKEGPLILFLWEGVLDKPDIIHPISQQT